ncbi:unnamed protein product [Amoebophrya sp. A120]|nr:unnamed protein product [Amoebophrya sp. A120]|eukprot:GSA120T00016459001.1
MGVVSSSAACCKPSFAGAKKLGVPIDPRLWTDDDRMRAAQALFYRFDFDDSGTVDAYELGELFRECESNLADFGTQTDQSTLQEMVFDLVKKRYNRDLKDSPPDMTFQLDLEDFIPVFNEMFSLLASKGFEKRHQLLGLVAQDALTVPAGTILDDGSIAQGGVNTHMLIVSLDYKYNKALELTGVADGKKMERLAFGCKNVSDVVTMFDSENELNSNMFPHARNIAREIKQMGKRMKPGDLFLFFYSGHGLNVPDKDGDEADGEDEAFATPDFEGDLVEDEVLVDDDFARFLHQYIPKKCRIVVITDCCHSGSICDVDSFAFQHEIIAIAASQDSETSIDMSSLGQSGGILTTALLEAIDELHQTLREQEHQEMLNRPNTFGMNLHENFDLEGTGGPNSYKKRPPKILSIQALYNLCVAKTGAIASKLQHQQSMNIQYANCTPEAFPWPLLPYQ